MLLEGLFSILWSKWQIQIAAHARQFPCGAHYVNPESSTCMVPPPEVSWNPLRPAPLGERHWNEHNETGLSYAILKETNISLSVLRSAVGMTHDLRSDLWWTIPLRILLGQIWDTNGSRPIKSALARHSGVQVPVIPAKRVRRSFLTNHSARLHKFRNSGNHHLCQFRRSVSTVFINSNYMPINIGTFHILPTCIHGLCFGFCFAGPLPLRSLLHGPLPRVHFGESLIVRLYSEIDHIHLSSEAQCVSHLYPRWTASVWQRLFTAWW